MAHAAAPTLISAGDRGGHATARWSLPAGFASRFVEVGDSRGTRAGGEFADPALRDRVGGRQRTWRSSSRLDPGVYFVHVSGVELGCGTCREQWSNVRKLVIRTARRYAGRTNQGRGISFVLRALGTRIVPLKFRIFATCAGGYANSSVVLGGPIKVRRDGRFSSRARFRSAIDSLNVRVRGRLIDPPGSVQRGVSKGIVRFTATRSPAGRCESGRIHWTARGQGWTSTRPSTPPGGVKGWRRSSPGSAGSAA